MKTGLAILAGLLVADGIATGISINTSGCKVEKNVQDQFSCPCNGGSGVYDWHFTQLPDGWQAKDDKIFAPKGKFQNKKVYGAKVEVIDKQTKDSVKKSIFFTLENGKVGKIADHDFNFDVKKLVDNKTVSIGGISGVVAPTNSAADDNVKKIFDGANGIGGGCGLVKLRPYFGAKGLYAGDNKNPSKDKLPTDNDVDKVIEAGKSQDIRDVVVNAARSKVSCKDISAFLEKLFQKLRVKIGHSKDDVDVAKKSIATLQAQIVSLQSQLKDAEANGAAAATLSAQLQQFKLNLAQADQNRIDLQAQLKTASSSFESLQADLSNFVQ